MAEGRGNMPADGNWKAVHLSRSEVLELVFGKLQLIREECDRIDHEDSRPTERDLLDIIKSFRRINLESKRAASLIATHCHVAKGGHCIHCGKTYEEHETDDARTEQHAAIGRQALLPKKPALPGGAGPRCLALQRLFDSVELETYQPLAMLEGL